MSFRSGSNTDFIFNNLKVNGKLTLVNELEITDLVVEGDTKLNTLEVTGDTNLNALDVQGATDLNTLAVTGNTILNVLNVTGKTVLAELDVQGDTSLNNVSVAGTTSLQALNSVGPVNFSDPVFNTEYLTVYKELSVVGDILANSETITPAELGYLSNLIGNIQGQLDSKVETNNAVFTGTTTLPTTKATGLLNATHGITTTTLNATGASQLSSLNVNGNLTVTGNITSSSPSNMEILYFQLRGSANNVIETMTLAHNVTATTNYSVFPNIYYGFSGSSGTYDSLSTSSAINNIVIGARTDSSFNWSINKATGNNVNVFLVFLVIYNASSSAYPSYYTS